MFTLRFYGLDETQNLKSMISANTRYPTIERARGAASTALKQIMKIEIVHIIRVGSGGNAFEVIKRPEATAEPQP